MVVSIDRTSPVQHTIGTVRVTCVPQLNTVITSGDVGASVMQDLVARIVVVDTVAISRNGQTCYINRVVNTVNVHTILTSS